MNEDLPSFLRSGASLMVATAGPSGVPELCMALACLVDAERSHWRIVLDAREAEPLLAVLRDGGDRLALVASRPSDLRTVQIKGCEARLQPQPLTASELRHTQESNAVLRKVLVGIEFGDRYASTLLQHLPDRLVTVEFRPTDVFEQTPGPQAGQLRGSLR